MGKIDTKVFSLSIPGAPNVEVSCELTGRVGSTYQSLTISSGGASSQEFKLITAVDDNDLNAGSVQFQLDLTIPEKRDRFVEKGFCGLKFEPGIELSGVRIAVRCADRQSEYTAEHPFFSLYLDWTVTATAAAGTKWSNGGAAGGAQLRLPLTTGFACIRPPTLPNIGLPDLECRLDLSGIVVTTGWRSLTLPNLNIELPQIGSWFGWLAGVNLTVALPSWNVSLPLIPTLPLGVGFKTTDLTLEQTGSGHRLKATAKTLQIAWRGATVLEYEDFEASLTYDGAQYVLNVQLVEAHYPADGVSTIPDKLTLPAGALTIECACWRFRFGVFADNAGGSTSLCPELLIEMGGLAVGSQWATKPLWQAQALRLHLRGTSVLTCKAITGTLFYGVAGSAFGAYRLPLAGHGLTELWPAVGTPPPEDPKVEFVDGSFDKDGLITLLWKQDNDRILHALLKAVPWIDKQQAEPPPGGKTLVALQFARFGKDRQLRLEWRPDTLIAVVGAAAPQPPAGGEVCAALNGTEIVLLIPPAASGGAAAGPIVDRDFSLSLPGVNVALAQPQMRSLVFYGGDEKWSVSLLHAYDAVARTIASASFNAMRFLTAGPSEDAAQNALPAMPGDGAKPFAALNLASDGSRWQALAMLSWTDGELPRVMQALEGSGAAFEPLYPNNVGVVVGDCAGCPVEAAKPQPIPLCLSTTRFASPHLNEAEGWRFDMAVQAANDLFRDKGGTIGPVNISIEKVCRPSDANAFDLYAKLKVDVLNNKVEGSAVLRLDLSDMSVRLRDKAAFDIQRDVSTVTPADHLAAFKLDKELHFDVSEPIHLLELDIYLVRTLPKKNGPVPAAASLPFLRLTLEGGRYLVELNEGKLEGEVYQAFVVSKAMGLLCFEVSKFRIGSGGLDLTAKLLPTQIKVDTLKEPFLLNDASLEIVGNRMRHLSIGATGKLPELLSSAPIRLTIGLKQDDTGIVLDELVCELADKDKPIVTTGVRFRFEISQLELRYRRTAAGEKLFFFEVSGKAQFEPDLGEFDGKLLENLKTATIEFNRAPLSDEFIEHVEFSVELREPVVFEVFKVFRMEIRSLGFHPKYDFSGSRDPKRMCPALIVGGQCLFADTGDVISAEIDFHKLYIGMPAAETAVPQVDFKDLRVEVQAAGGFRLGGSVVSIDEPKRKGFKGDGVIAIPGLPELSAAVGFMQLQRSDGAWVRAWFIAIEASKISYQIPPLPIYLRQIGGGLGVRMFPVIMRGVDEDQPLTKMIERMSANIDAHITLARQESWFDQVEEPGEPALWVVALEAAFTLGTTQGQGAKYDEEAEKGLRTIVVQLFGALGSDLTMVTAMKAWLPISVDDYFNDRENMHQRPLVKGFMLYSPRQQRLLAYATKGKDVYYGPKGDKIAEFYKLILDPMPFEFVALIEPNRVRGEIGWVDRLVFSLDIGLLKIECRGGILFAIEQRMIVHGIYFAARGKLGLRGGAGGGSLGLRLVAEADVNFATRLLVGQHMLLPLPAGIYGQVGISVNVVLMIQAWLHIDFRFFSIDIDLEFSLTIQILLSLEVGLAGGTDIGFKGYATVGISIFGRSLSARIAVGLNEGAVGNARNLMQSFLSSVLEPGKVPPVPGATPVPAVAGALGPTPTPTPGLGAGPAPTPAGAASPPAGATTEQPATGTGALPAGQTGAPTLPVAVAVDGTNSEPFAFSVIEAGSVEGNQRWVIWIMPTPKDGVFYPVPVEGKAEYAKVTGLVAPGATIKVFAEDGTLVPVTHEKATIVVDSDRRFKSKNAPESVKLSLRTLLAGSYTAESGSSAFPFDIGIDLPTLHAVDASTSIRTVLADDRVVLGPRHVDPDFNPNHPYDRALNEDAPNADTSPRALALGNQAFLMQWMHDGVQRLAAALAAGEQPDPRGPDTPIGLADLGMVLVIEGELPDWATKRDATTTRPSIRFVSEQGFAVEHTVHECSLQPLVAPDRIRFANGGVRLLYDPIAHFDEDLLALAWDIGWTKPFSAEEIAAGAVAPGIGTEVKDFLRHYRVEIFDLGGVADKPLLVRDVLPASRETETHTLQNPYTLTVRTTELFPTQLGDGGVRRQVLVTVTPVSQAGDEGRTFTITAQLRPRLTPLPPEDAELELSFTRDSGNIRPVASLTWSQPPIPNKPGIAFPTDWEIVVRHLPQVPIGHYPQATVAVGESEGRMSSDRTCRPGDLIMRVNGRAAQGLLGETQGPDGRELFKLMLPDNNLIWVDYLGKGIDPNSTLAKLRSAFQEQATETGWQLFIRSRSVTSYADGSSDATYSSMSAVRLHAQLKRNQLAGAQQQGEAQASSDKDRITVGHLEWPRAPEPLVPSLRRPTAVMGPLHVPLLKSVASDPVIKYVNGGDARRAVTVRWSGFAEATAPLARLAGFRILEAQDETLLNADLDGPLESPDFQPVWTEITRFDAADREIAGRSPSTLADTKNWQAWPPALAKELRKPSSERVRTSQIQTEVPGLPLVWPPELSRSDFPALKDLQSAPSTATGDKLPLADGWRIAGRRLHAALDWFLGYLDVAVGKKGWILTAATGKPLNSGVSVADWMGSNTAIDDPQGWAALWQLGLGVELLARDASTGLAIGQMSLLKEVEAVFASLKGGVHEPAWTKIRDHLSLDLPIQAADALLAESKERPLAEIGLDRLQVSLRPTARGEQTSVLPAELTSRIEAVDWPWREFDEKEMDERKRIKAMSETDKEETSKRYVNWARRFVDLAPTASPSEGFIFDINNTTTVAPLAATIETLCADGVGEYRFTREVKQQWALSRLVRVVVEQRYDRLIAAMGSESIRATDDWSFESVGGYIGNRVRRLEPPQLLSERLIKQEDGQVFHEVVFARHAEAALSAANIPAVRQLEFLGTERRYQRVFYDIPWVDKLGVVPGPVLSKPRIGEIDDAWTPAFPEDDEFLKAVPSARFGALGFLTPTEAFFYDTKLNVRSRAVACKSEIVNVPLHRKSASETEPWSDPGLSVKREHGGVWPDELAGVYKQWKTALSAGDPVLESLKCCDYLIETRFPRYFESLTNSERDRERVEGTVAMLPDGGATLQFSLTRIGMEETFAAVRTERGSQAGVGPFVLIQTGPEVAAYDLQHSLPGAWSEGMQISFRARLDSASVVVRAQEGRPLASRVPCAVNAWKPGLLPSVAPLARAAPLALRIATDVTETVRFFNPFEVALDSARPLTRAHVVFNPEVLADAKDLSFGIRLLLDPERMAAAVAFGAGDGAPVDLADAIETAPAVTLRRIVAPTDPALWQQMLDGLRIWVLADAADAIWTRCALDAEVPAVQAKIIVAAHEGSEDWQGVLEAFLAFAGDDGDPDRARSVPELEELTSIAQRMADAVLAPLNEVRVTAWVQRENEPRTQWGNRHG